MLPRTRAALVLMVSLAAAASAAPTVRSESQVCGYDSICAEGQVCTSGQCIYPDGTVDKGSQCDPEAVGSDRCKTGLSCAKADGRPYTELDGENVCVEYVDTGCDEQQYKVCQGNTNARKVCQNGQCVASKIGLYADACDGDTGVTCYGGDASGFGALTCFDFSSLEPSSGKQCGALNMRYGQECSTGVKGAPIGLRCDTGLTCEGNGESPTGICGA